MIYDMIRYDMMPRDAVRCDEMRCDAMRYDVSPNMSKHDNAWILHKAKVV